jgi:hypothetical protein
VKQKAVHERRFFAEQKIFMDFSYGLCYDKGEKSADAAVLRQLRRNSM